MHYRVGQRVFVSLDEGRQIGTVSHVSKPGMPHASYTVALDFPLRDQYGERLDGVVVGADDLKLYEPGD